MTWVVNTPLEDFVQDALQKELAIACLKVFNKN